mmetsp:Transcript_8006/g.23663  ORF Transcript_8006/g.23663 Transcript_8006/m.23663 type:complete len:215 (+) Transcript_8006:429-1073(+)
MLQMGGTHCCVRAERRASSAAARAAGIPSGFLPPACAALGRPPPPPPQCFASCPTSLPAFTPALTAAGLEATAMATLPGAAQLMRNTAAGSPSCSTTLVAASWMLLPSRPSTEATRVRAPPGRVCARVARLPTCAAATALRSATTSFCAAFSSAWMPATRAGTSSRGTLNWVANPRATTSTRFRYSTAASPTTASMRRTPEATADSWTTLKAPI